jgi:hypothetical protein
MRSGDHIIIIIYEEHAELLAFAIPFFKEDLVQGSACFVALMVD